MKQLYYEIKKVFGQRFFMVITAVLLVTGGNEFIHESVLIEMALEGEK